MIHWKKMLHKEFKKEVKDDCCVMAHEVCCMVYTVLLFNFCVSGL